VLTGSGRWEQKEGALFLFQNKHPWPTQADIWYCRALRNKYAHQRGSKIIAQREQLSDLIILQRLLASLVGHMRPRDENKRLREAIDRLISELVEAVAQAAMPDKYDLEPPPPTEATVSGASGMTSAKILAERMDAFEQSLRRMGTYLAVVPHIQDALRQLTADVRRFAELKHDGAVSGTPATRLESKVSDAYHDVEGKPPDASDSTGNEDAALDAESDRNLPGEQAREELIALRRRIWRETGRGPSSDGLLRKSMLDAFLTYLPQTRDEALRAPMGTFIHRVAEVEQRYLPQVLEILRRTQGLPPAEDDDLPF
jgi:hypothetical protein